MPVTASLIVWAGPLAAVGQDGALGSPVVGVGAALEVAQAFGLAEQVPGRLLAHAVHEFDVPAGASLPVAHSHDAFGDTIYGVSGTVAFTVESTAHDIRPDETLFIAHGAIHAFAKTGATDATALAIITPACSAPTTFARWQR